MGEVVFEWNGHGVETPTGVAVFKFADGNVSVTMPSFTEAFALSQAFQRERERVARRARKGLALEIERHLEQELS